MDFKYISKPIIWTIHDSWAFTGGCYLPQSCKGYETGCQVCPLFNNYFAMYPSVVVKEKLRYWKDKSLTIVAPSNWLADCARNSLIFKEIPIHVIHNGIDVEIFKPIEKAYSKNSLGIPENNTTILFGAKNALRDKNKGFLLLMKALNKLKIDFTLLVFGAEAEELNISASFEVRFFGTIKNDEELNNLYNAADVTIVPSFSENLSFTIMESLACGTPVVAFNIGGNSDMIDHKKNGYLALPYEVEELANGIQWCIENNYNNALGVAGRKKVEEKFTIEKIADEYIELYKKVIGKIS